jgi:uncharacterized protein (DUF2236 family)
VRVNFTRVAELISLALAGRVAVNVSSETFTEVERTPDLEMAPLVAFRQPVPAAARGNLAVQNHVIRGTLPPRVREIFGIRWSGAHEASFRTIAAAHRRAHLGLLRSIRYVLG